MKTNEAYSNILQRRSCRSFHEAAVALDQIELLLQAAFSAPYAAKNSRHYAVVRNANTLRRLNDAAKETAVKRQIPGLDALAGSPEYNCLYGAPAAILISGSRHSVAPESDCAAAAENILLAAQALGLGSCWVFFPLLAFEGDAAEMWLAELKIPEDYKPLAAVVFGYGKGAPAMPAARSEPVSYILN